MKLKHNAVDKHVLYYPQFRFGSASSIARYAKAYSETATGWVGDLVRLIAGDAEAA